MGTLVAWHYRSNLFAKMADHTYVTCGNGARRWKCWGGCKGGDALIQGVGETKQAMQLLSPVGERALPVTSLMVSAISRRIASYFLLVLRCMGQGATIYLSHSTAPMVARMVLSEPVRRLLIDTQECRVIYQNLQ